MSLFLAMIFGGLGTSFGRLGARQAPTGGGSPPSYSPSLDFSDARNSQYVSVVGG